MKRILSVVWIVSVMSSALTASVVKDDLVFFVSGSAPGSDPNNIWEPIVGSGGTLYEGTQSNKPAYDNTSEIFGFYSFDGGNYAMFPDQDQVGFLGTEAFTIETWIKFAERETSYDSDVLGTKGKSVGFNGWRFQPFYNAGRGADRNGINGGDGQAAPKLYLQDRENPVQRWYINATGYSIDGEQWAHVVMTYDPSIINSQKGCPSGEIWINRIYKTIEEQHSGGTSGTEWYDPAIDGDWTTDPINFFIGKIAVLPGLAGTENPFWGDIAAVRLYDRALTTDEVETNYAAGPGAILLVVGQVLETDGSTEVTEGGNTDSVGIVLTSAPASDVNVAVSYDSNDITVSPASLTFTGSNWNQEQYVTITAVDDTFIESTESAKLYFDSDGEFTGQIISSVDVDIIDNDKGEVLFTPVAPLVSEQGETSDSVDISLTVAPIADDIVINLDYDSAQISLDVASFTFNTSNWSTPQTMTITAIDDTVYEADPHTAAIGAAVVTTDIAYAGIEVADLSVDILDNECGPGRYLPGDADENCVVDISDFANMAANWLDCSLPNVPGCITP